MSAASTTVSNFFPTFSSTPNSGDNGGNNGVPGSSSSSLYLFTFLATLLLLLAVSCAIIARSFIVRRRFRQRVEEAIAAGVITPQQGGLGGGRRRDFGEKPTLWDAYVVPGDESWDTMKPVSAKIISEKYTGSGYPLDPKGRPSFQIGGLGTSSVPPLTIMGKSISNPFNRRRPGPTSSSQPPASETSSESHLDAEPIPDPAKLQVSVLIAMPSAHKLHGSSTSSLRGKERSLYGDGDDEVPDVVLGVAELPWPSHVSLTNDIYA